MTTPDLAAALLRDVKLYEPDWTKEPFDRSEMVESAVGDWLSRADVLAALSRALDPAIAERAGEVVERLRGRPDAIEDVDRLRDEAADLITDLLTANAALRAERDALVKDKRWIMEERDRTFALMLARAEAAEAKVKKLRAERDDALTFLDNAVSKAPDPLKALGKYLAGRLDEDEWPTAEQYLNAAAKACAALTTEADNG